MSWGVQCHSLPHHSRWVISLCPLCGLHTPSICSWASIALIISIGVIYWGQSASVTGYDHWVPTSNHHGGSAGQGPTPQSRAYFSRALVPATFAPWLCPMWRWLGWWCSYVIWSCPLGMLTLGPSRRFRPRSAALCVLTRVIQHKLSEDGCYLCWA